MAHTLEPELISSELPNLFKENVLASSIFPEHQSIENRRSNHESKLPQKFNDYIIEGKYKYGIE